ncbi:unnamed protein product [Prorocentrum cordatum]|uniref:Spondin-like TSP1 domain-containing protein n=1 Tax=Prorocentrum cordatum TaxID=2364126 RepID=A0ABN9TM36_9DINO|nr:unnamed protein product [Polarella glacialis]
MPCVLGQTTRNRSVTTQPAGGGRSCAATLRETATCARRPVDCEVADWTPWALCDRTCGGGQTNRQRQVLQFPANGGRPCPADLVEVRGCNSEACLHKNCEVGDWGAWGMCSTSCGAGQQMRSRAVLGLRDSQGYGCDDTLGETRDCRENPPCQRQDCEWGVWSEWGQCSVTCGGGQRSRNRSVVSPPSGGGSTCTANDREEVGPCNTKACTDVTSCIDGRWADWEHWAPCSVSCGGGQTFRKRKIMSSANFCGAEPTGSDSEMKFCNVWTECQKSSDCKMTSWGDWSACTAPCNGVKRRTRRVESYGTGKGQACEGALEMMEPCNPSPDEKMPAICSHGEPVDCELDQWTSWGDCSASCDGGQRVRHRDILQDPMFGGKACNSSTSQIEECGRSSCSGASPVDCEFGDWEPWGECTKCAGQRKRFRKIVTHGMHGGQSCGAFDSQEVGKCPRDCDENVFCVWKDWDEWSDCTATCGNSSKKQRRRYLHLSSSTKKDDEAPLPPAQDVMARYMDLQRRAKVLDRNHFLELFVAFAGGSISLVVVVAGIRIFNTARGSRAGWLPTGFWNGDALEQVGLTLIDPGVASRSRSMNEVELPLVGAGWN